MIRDVLGLRNVDPVAKTLHVRFADLSLDWCKGAFPTRDGVIELEWKKQGKNLTYRLVSPPDYKVEVENASGKSLVKE